MKTKSVKIDLSKFELLETGEFTCYANVFEFVDQANDSTVPGCFIESIAYHAELGTMPKFCFNHDDNLILGKWLEWDEDENGLLMKGQFNLETPLGLEKYHNVKNGDLSEFSIQYATIDEDEILGVNYLKCLHVVEVSLVTFPCNEASLLIDVKSKSQKPDIKSFNEGLRLILFRI
ncbi:HK97 family phage prohead protease [Aeromonas media]|uniref:HK97 family phage prohead protease n=1 Tax=Aeromonas media TaxID=651 RepID=UPI0038CF38F2